MVNSKIVYDTLGLKIYNFKLGNYSPSAQDSYAQDSYKILLKLYNNI